MSVTQDYKILTLTRTEVVAVRQALIDAEVFLGKMWGTEVCQFHKHIIGCMLNDVQSALAKVRA